MHIEDSCNCVNLHPSLPLGNLMELKKQFNQEKIFG